MSVTRIAGRATRGGTEQYAATFGAGCGAGHFSDFLNQHLKLSSLGVGTFPGAASTEVDANYARVVASAATAGINVFDTAAHYRYGRSARALGAGLREAFRSGVRRDQVFVVGKGGFLAFADRPPERLDAWVDAHVVARGLGTRQDVVGHHLLTPAYVEMQLETLRDTIGVETLDAFLVDQPEVQIAAVGKERMHRRLGEVFESLEGAVRDGRIGCYGISSFASFRVETDAPLFQSIASLLGLAERAATAVHGAAARHAMRILQLPFNQAMSEGFTRFSQATGQGNVASALQAAHQLRVFVMASHALAKGVLAGQSAEAVRAALAALPNDAQRALQFSRSTPGVGTSLVGVSTPAHLADLLAVARLPVMPRADYLKLYERT